MTWAFVLRPQEMATYRRCRRAWDLGARIRQNYIPAVSSRPFDFDKAIHDALAVYYFPAMDDWDRSIVRPLALKGFSRSMAEQVGHFEEAAPLTPEQERDFEEASALGNSMLNGYFTWSAPLDTFASIFSDQEYWAPIPDPDTPGSDLATHLGREMRYLGRVDQLFSDHNDEYWMAIHRLVGNRWLDDDDLLLDLDGLTALWATELTYPQLRIAGTVYNELRMDLDTEEASAEGATTGMAAWATTDGRTMRRPRHIHTRRSPISPDEPGPGADVPGGDAATDRITERYTGEWFRRTFVRRARGSVRAVGPNAAAEAREVADPGLAIYPNPSPDNCRDCAFRAPCLAMSAGLDAGLLLDTAYRHRTEEEGEEERLRWSIGRAQTRASMSGKDSRPNTVNFHWG
ncbi:MAG TPA: hypothetical protein VFW71_04890 [Actinomycetota bacterium]|nr:hypothetical protein [Actinomycetota bacterium]